MNSAWRATELALILIQAAPCGAAGPCVAPGLAFAARPAHAGPCARRALIKCLHGALTQ
jgi:hypothetical protein